MTKTPSVLIGCGHLIRNIEVFRPIFEKAGIMINVPTLKGQQFSAEEMLALLPGHNAAILGDDVITADVIKASVPQLKFLIKWGIGTDNIDLEQAASMGVPVYNTPGQFSAEVAELAIGMMLTLARQINITDSKVRNGAWVRVEGESLQGARAHIIGMGNIGGALAKRLAAFGLRLTGSDPSAHKGRDDFPCVDLMAGIKDADWVFVACSLTPKNAHLIDDELISAMKPGARIINVARGGLIDEASLIKHLTSGHLQGAGLDVFEKEPFAADNPLADFLHVVLGNHGGSSTHQAIRRVNILTVEMAINLLTGHGGDASYNRVN